MDCKDVRAFMIPALYEGECSYVLGGGDLFLIKRFYFHIIHEKYGVVFRWLKCYSSR